MCLLALPIQKNPVTPVLSVCMSFAACSKVVTIWLLDLSLKTGCWERPCVAGEALELAHSRFRPDGSGPKDSAEDTGGDPEDE